MPTMPVYPPFKQLYIELHHEDRCGIGSYSFKTLPEFKQFLLDNPEILKVLRTGKLDNGVTIPTDQDMDLENRI